jgi:simple sugar transport system permease protein
VHTPDAGIAVAVAGFLAAAVRVATPLALAATGETVAERAGVINVGLEGIMLGGSLGAAWGAAASGSPWAGLLAGMLAGLLIAAVFALVAIRLGGDQIVVGTAVTLGAIGVTGALYRALFGPGGAALSLPTLAPIRLPVLASIPAIGPALFDQPAPTYMLYALSALAWLLLTRTQPGLALRAAGESPAAAAAAGIDVRRLRSMATLANGAMAGLAGAALVLAQTGTFAERMTAGRGFIAIAIVVLGRWHPFGVLAAALLFGAASAMQYAVQAVGLDVPYQFVLMAPYLVTLLALAGVGGRARAPEALGRAV